MLTDALRELAIWLTMKAMLALDYGKHKACALNRRLILGRSPRQVERMEAKLMSKMDAHRGI